MARVTQGERGRDYRTRTGGGREEEEASFTPPYFPSPKSTAAWRKREGEQRGKVALSSKSGALACGLLLLPKGF